MRPDRAIERARDGVRWRSRTWSTASRPDRAIGRDLARDARARARSRRARDTLARSERATRDGARACVRGKEFYIACARARVVRR